MPRFISNGLTVRSAQNSGFFVEGGNGFDEPIRVLVAGSLSDCLDFVRERLRHTHVSQDECDSDDRAAPCARKSL